MTAHDPGLVERGAVAHLLTKGGVLHLTTPFRTSGSTLSGEGWTITLASGWTVRPGKRPGDFEIVMAGGLCLTAGKWANLSRCQ